jgi:toxin ParE1/3/4
MTGRRIVRRVGARIDVVVAVENIAANNPRAASRFVRAVRATEEALLANPGMGSRRDFHNPALVGMRVHSIRGFRKYLVFYIPGSNGIDVVRVLHGARSLEALFDIT